MALLTVLAALSVLSLLSATVLADARWALQRSAQRSLDIEHRWAREACVAVLRAHRIEPPNRLDLGTGRWCSARRIDPGALVNRTSVLAEVLATQEPLAERRERWLTDLGDGRLSLASAPAELLALLPGLDGLAIQSIMRQQRTGRPFRSMDEFLGTLGAESRRAALSEYRALMQLSTLRSDFVAIVVQGGSAASARSARSIFDARSVDDSITLLARRSSS